MSAVDDAAQHVFLIALQKLAQIEAGSERAFLLGTAVGVAANARRTRGPSGSEVADADAVAGGIDPALNPEQAAIVAERRALVEQILDRMGDELRVVFVLFELEGLTSLEIAELLAIPVGTVWVVASPPRARAVSSRRPTIARAAWRCNGDRSPAAPGGGGSAEAELLDAWTSQRASERRGARARAWGWAQRGLALVTKTCRASGASAKAGGRSRAARGRMLAAPRRWARRR